MKNSRRLDAGVTAAWTPSRRKSARAHRPRQPQGAKRLAPSPLRAARCLAGPPIVGIDLVADAISPVLLQAEGWSPKTGSSCRGGILATRRPSTRPFAVNGGLSGFGPRSFFALELLLTGTCWKPYSLEPYSYRRATTGSTRIARRAGGYDASRATTRNEIETTTK